MSTNKYEKIISNVAGTQRVKRVKLSELTVDPRVQQPLREGKVREMLRRGYDPALVGTIVVSERTDGSKVVLDGQTRAETGRRSGASDILAIVWTGLTLEDEAFLFTYLNKKSNPTAVATFLTRIVAGEVVPVGINDVLTRNGWYIGLGKTADGRFAAVNAAERIYMGKGDFKTSIDSEDVFARAVETVTTAWGHDGCGVDAAILGGVAQFLIRYWEEVEDDRLTRALARTTAESFRSQVRSFQSVSNEKPVVACAYKVHQEYNKRGRSKLAGFAL